MSRTDEMDKLLDNVVDKLIIKVVQAYCTLFRLCYNKENVKK